MSPTPPRRRVPEDAVDAGALLELAPPGIAVHLLVVRLFQHHRQHAGKRLRGLPHRLPPGQHVGVRVVVHGIGVLVGNAVEQPPAGGLRLAGHHGVLVVFPVSHAEPQLVIHRRLSSAALPALYRCRVCMAAPPLPRRRAKLLLLYLHNRPFRFSFRCCRILPCRCSSSGSSGLAARHSAPAG